MADNSRPPIMVKAADGKWLEVQPVPYDNERGLQEMLLESPSLLPGVSAAAVVDELWIEGIGNVDIVAVSPDGSITLVECKLRTNADMRRTVVGQVLAYASGLWQQSYETFDQQFTARAGSNLATSVQAVAKDEEAEWDEESFRSEAALALRDGHFRLCIAVDEVTDELRRIVEFLNIHTAAGIELVLFEAALVSAGSTQILVPRTFGGESARIKGSVSHAGRAPWPIETVFEHLATLTTSAVVDGVRLLYDRVNAWGGRTYGGKGAFPTFSMYVKIGGKIRSLCAVLADPAGGDATRMTLNLYQFRQSVSDAAFDAIVGDLQQISALAPYLVKVHDGDAHEYPTVPLKVLGEPGVALALADAWAKQLGDPAGGS